LLCGKEIGPLRLLRDDEFCSSAHRSRYNERLSKALGSIAAPEPAPAPIAGFRAALSPNEGNLAYTAALFGFDPQTHPIQFRASCPVRVDAVFGGSMKVLRAASAQNRAGAVQWIADPLARGETSIPGFHLELMHDEPQAAVAQTEQKPPMASDWASLPPAPVESFIVPASAVQWMDIPVAAVRVPQSAGAAIARPAIALAEQTPSPAACEVASFITYSASFETLTAAEALAPRFELTVAADAPVEPEEVIEVVAACEDWMPSPAADPVTSFVEWKAASAMPWMEALASAPLQLHLTVTPTFVPASSRLARPPLAEPAAMFVFPINAAQAISAPVIVMRGTDPIFDLALDSASYVEGPKPQPVESMPAAQVVVPAASTIATIISISETPVPAAACSYGHSPAEHQPVPVESFVFPSFQAAMMAASTLALPALTLESADKFAPALERSLGANSMPAAQVAAAQSRPADLQPIRTLALVRPSTVAETPVLTVPEQDFVHLEFYCQRPVASVSRNLEWMAPNLALMQPPFAVRPAFDKLEEATPQKKASKKPAMAEIFSMPEAKRKAANPAVRYAIKAIAASIVMGGVLWFGVGTMRIGNQTPAVNRDVSMVDNANETTPSTPVSTAPNAPVTTVAARTESHGPVARLRHAISDRAAATVTDSFRNGMEAWGTKPKAWAAGWSRHPEGYVQPGQLALFNPSVNYRDYHLEFFGQIDNKSMGWTVRSKDPKNYYAMKFTVVEPGLRPIIAIVHYPVIGGKKGHQSETPLNVMVHNNAPFQVAVDVKGNRMVTSIDGQEVDTWIDETLPTGGVGFFADTGEKARLYWMKVSKNEDFLGRVCAYLSSKLGDGSNTSAEFCAPEMPGQLPLPDRSVPGGPREATLAAAMLGMRRTRGKRSGVRIQRSETWSS
jgi:hypothetical protein